MLFTGVDVGCWLYEDVVGVTVVVAVDVAVVVILQSWDVSPC